MVLPLNSRQIVRVAWLALAPAVFLGISGAACNKTPLVAPSGSSITLLASPSVTSDGSVEITAVVIEGGLSSGTGGSTTVTPGAGTPVQNGTLVSFTTSLGHVEPAEARTSNGKATTKYFGDGQIGTATITAISGASSKTLDLAVGSPPAHVVLTANPAALPAGGGSTTVVAQVQDQFGNGVNRATVTFTTNAGTLAPTFAQTDSNGFATTTLTSTGAAAVTATTAGIPATSGGTATSLTATVNVTIKTKVTVTLTAPTGITVSVPATFAVTVSAAAGAAIVNDVVIDFGDGNKQSLGQVTSSAQATNLFGKAGATTVKVTATDTDGQTTTVSSPIVVAPLSAVGVANPSSVALGGSILFTVTTTAGALIDHYVFDFGDGDGASGPSNAQSHVYLTKGGHTAIITVFPVAGPSFVLQVPIVIN
ncbi:MAG TPA: Ig-like domain-containing protein [Vicinamibacterales bacterium]|nr:Ig-like domain-containing protein [Vicinamibacterales bacterium]